MMLRLLISVSGVVLGYITASCFYVYTPQIGVFFFYNVIPWGFALDTLYVYGSAFLQEYSDPVTVTVAQSLSQAQILYAQLYAELLPNVGYEFLAKFKESGSNISSSTRGNGGNVKYFIIPSILEKELSPLEMNLNSEIILNVLMLLHICIILLIGLHKLYISSGLNIISKLFSKKIAAKYEKFKKMIDNIGTAYLILLIIINVILIIFYIFVLIFVNVILTNNLDAFIEGHLKMKQGAMMLLLVKPNFIVNKNNIDKFKYFNVSSRVSDKKQQKKKKK